MLKKFVPSYRERQPSYRYHKARNYAVVTLNGKDHYLGPYDSPESHEKYARLIAEWRANGKNSAPTQSPDKEELTINKLLLKYLEFASEYYVKNGKTTGEVNNIRNAVAKLKELY